MTRTAILAAALLVSTSAFALPAASDRVYTADQNSNTVSVIDPVSNKLLGQIRLGNPRPDVLSPLYKGEVNVHGLGFSPDHKTLVVVSTVTNSVTFIDTATNAVKGTTYVGRNPHEAFFTPDGREVWATVRGEDYLSVIDATTFKEMGRIPTTSGPGMTKFSRDGKLAFVANSFNPVLEVFDVASHALVKRIPVVSPFVPFVQVSPDGSDVWLTHKDVGKVTRVDARTLEVKEVIDSGPISNHLGFGTVDGETLVYVTIGGENVVKVYKPGETTQLVATIPVGALPHGIWGSEDGSRIFVGLENGDKVDVIDTAEQKVVAEIPIGQAPQALVFVPGAVPEGAGTENLMPLKAGPENLTLSLKAPEGADGSGMVVSRNLGLVDAIDVSVAKLKPMTEYGMFFEGEDEPVVVLKTNDKGAGMASSIGPVRTIGAPKEPTAGKEPRLVVVEGLKGKATPVLASR
ncbi:YVTN family beta-propeller protein [Rhizobium sp. PP-F2F-G38]|nr:YVTN family beta-propeller protein [Rhizobium sp. PP-F2F-G38]